jgi:hypothetical protein
MTFLPQKIKNYIIIKITVILINLIHHSFVNVEEKIFHIIVEIDKNIFVKKIKISIIIIYQLK